MLRLIRRHTPACQKTKESDFDCIRHGAKKKESGFGCPFTIIGPNPLKPGARFKQATETADIRIATAMMQKQEMLFLLEPEKVTAKKPKTLRQATDLFLATLKPESDRLAKFTRLLAKQIEFLEAKHGPDVVLGPNTPIERHHLDEFVRDVLKTSNSINTRTVTRENVKQFWLYCMRQDFTPKNLSDGLAMVVSAREREIAKDVRVPTFTADEVARIDEAMDHCAKLWATEERAEPGAVMKTRAFTYVMRFSGLSIGDTLTLKPSDMKPMGAGGVAIRKRRIKTGKIANTHIPLVVWEMIQQFKPTSDYYFWSGKSFWEAEEKYRDRMNKLFVAADVRVFDKTARKRSGGKYKPEPETFKHSEAIPHWWRHTLVRDLYLKNVPVRQIADILGDTPEVVTEYYSCFDDLRQAQAMNTMEALRQDDPVLKRLASL